MNAAEAGNLELARKLMFDQQYAMKKQDIINNIEYYQRMVKTRTELETAAEHRHVMSMLQVTVGFLIATFGILLAILVGTLYVTRRLNTGSASVMIRELREALRSIHDHKEQLEVTVVQRTKELEAKNVLLEEAKALADEANRAKSEFIANMSHEIRTPMNAIMGFNYLLQQSNLSEQQKDYVDKTILSAKNLLTIINDVLDFSKIEAKKIMLEQIDFDLYEVLSDTSNMISFKAYEKGLRLHFSVHPDVPQMLKGDPFRLSQVLLNLANNAIKFTEQGEVSVSVYVRLKKASSLSLQFDIEDTGIGMTQEEMKLLFRAFTQADMSTTRRYGG